MKNTIFTKTIATLLVVFAMSFAVASQTTTDAKALYIKAYELGEKEDFAGAEKKIVIFNFNVNSFGGWQYGTAQYISNGEYISIPRSQ